MLEAARGDGKFESLLMTRDLLEAVNQTTGEGIAAAYAIHNISDFIASA